MFIGSGSVFAHPPNETVDVVLRLPSKNNTEPRLRTAFTMLQISTCITVYPAALAFALVRIRSRFKRSPITSTTAHQSLHNSSVQLGSHAKPTVVILAIILKRNVVLKISKHMLNAIQNRHSPIIDRKPTNGHCVESV